MFLGPPHMVWHQRLMLESSLNTNWEGREALSKLSLLSPIICSFSESWEKSSYFMKHYTHHERKRGLLCTVWCADADSCSRHFVCVLCNAQWARLWRGFAATSGGSLRLSCDAGAGWCGESSRESPAMSPRELPLERLNSTCLHSSWTEEKESSSARQIASPFAFEEKNFTKLCGMHIVQFQKNSFSSIDFKAMESFCFLKTLIQMLSEEWTFFRMHALCKRNTDNSLAHF